MKKLLYLALASSLFVACSETREHGMQTITNDCFWQTVDGQPINSQGGGIFQFQDPRDGEKKYFWYGVHYAEADSFRSNPVRKYNQCTFEGVTLYTSYDLVNWTREENVLTPEVVNQDKQHNWLGRMGVTYVSQANLYALLIQQDNNVLVATSKSPLGPFMPYRTIDMLDKIGTHNTGDQTVFVDDDNRGYLVYSYGRGRNKTYISEIGVDQQTDSIGLLNCVQVFKGESREGNCMFKLNGRYYLCASNIYGWDASHAFFLSSDSIYGPYTPENSMKIMRGCNKDYAHVSQTGFFVTVHGSECDLVIFCGDRWADFANNGLGYNQWVPITLDPEDEPVFCSLSQWELDASTGIWRVGKENNYVMNPSFEADRRIIPLAVKPRQEELTGWKTTVVYGNEIGVDIPGSPQLNHLNSEEDQQHVVGKMSLCISDSVHFERIVEQTVYSSRNICLHNGTYTLTVSAKTTGDFEKIVLFADQDNETIETDLTGGEWHKVSMNVAVTNNTLRLGFHAVGSPLATCLVDDVELILQEKSE